MYDDEINEREHIEDYERDLADHENEAAERADLDEALNGDYTPENENPRVAEIAREQEAKNMYTDALARVVADTMALATLHGKEGTVSVSIDIFLDTLEAAGFAERAEVLKRATFILSQD